MRVGNDLKSCTSELGFGYMEDRSWRTPLDKHRIVLIDTPGFDDTYETDFVILERIANWLKEAYVSSRSTCPNVNSIRQV